MDQKAAPGQLDYKYVRVMRATKYISKMLSTWPFILYWIKKLKYASNYESRAQRDTYADLTSGLNLLRPVNAMKQPTHLDKIK